MAEPGFHVAAAGLKGLVFLRDIEALGRIPERVFSYRQSADDSESFDGVKEFCAKAGVELVEERRPVIAPGQRTFFVGWQYLFAGSTDFVVVFHDSLLPELRGFAPTATALIAGRSFIGITAFKPDSGVDTGPIYLQDGFEVRHPMRLAEALERQARMMAALADRMLAADAAGTPIAPIPQSEDGATYSIWRDGLDFDLDPALGADEFVRRVYALGYPYQGARIRVDGQILVVLDAVELEDFNFVIRDVGKVWRLDSDGPVVICGRGMVKLTDLRTQDGETWVPPRLRLRFERP